MNPSTLVLLSCDAGSAELARAELLAACPAAQLLDSPGEGVLLADLGRPWAELALLWRQAPPIFVRHLAPVQVIVPLGGHAGDPAFLARTLPPLLPPLQADRRFSVQTRLCVELPYKPFDINTTLSAALAGEAGPPLDVRSPEQIVSVLCGLLSSWQPAPAWVAEGFKWSKGRPVALAGLSLAADNLSNWAGGMRRFAREEGQVSRSEFKLLEALEVFGLELPARGVALDLGAAPGGWTRLLRQRDQYVTAVDPGELDPRLASDRGIRHLHITAEHYLEEGPDRFDLIVNDMRMDARDSARLMVAYARFLYPHGWALLTLKLPEQERAPIIEQALAILRRAYRVEGARQLFHNRSEITVLLRLPSARA